MSAALPVPSKKHFPRTCLIIDDNLQDAQFVELKDGKLVAGDFVNLIKNKFGDERLELDGEGIAFSHGFFYVIGSHGHPRDSDEKLDPVKDRERDQCTHCRQQPDRPYSSQGWCGRQTRTDINSQEDYQWGDYS